jgi:general secretion pathway protein K
MRYKTAKPKRSGFVVVVVLCMVVMLAVLLFGFNHKSRADLLEVHDSQRALQSLNCARAGLNIAIAAAGGTSEIHTNEKLLRLLSGQQEIPVSGGTCSITLAEESGKINVNLLKDRNGRLNRAAIDRLLRLIDLLNRRHFRDSPISYAVLPSIIDWVDADQQVTCLPFVKRENLGAESDYYNTLSVPYSCRDGSLEMVEELLLVKNMTPEVLGRIRDYVTVKGDGRININCAPMLVIESLSEKMDPVLAQMIIDRRKIEPFRSVAELRLVPGMTDNIYRQISGTLAVGAVDRYYHVTSRGSFDGLSFTIIAMLRRNAGTGKVDVIVYKEL